MSALLDATLLVMAKSPRPGRVKTRLCPPCTPEQAAAIAEASLADTLATVAVVPARRRVLVLEGPVGWWKPPSVAVQAQVDGGLATRLAGAFGSARGPTFVVGMDTPQVTVATLTAALECLVAGRHEALLGPAADGGWWGLGLVRPDGEVFHGVPMSSPRTGACQADRLRDLGLRTGRLPELRDVDDFADARAVAAGIPGSRFAARVAAVETCFAPIGRAS